MRKIAATVDTEYLKLKRSKIIWITIILFIFIPLMMSLLMFLAKFPELASKFGMVGTKSSMLRIGNPDWTNFFMLITQTFAGIGLVFFGFITSWTFGREYADQTIKDLLALPVSRSYIVIAKFIVVLIWCIILSVIFFITVLVSGKLINLTGWSSELALQSFVKFSVTTLLTLLLCSPVAFFASYGRGYMLPIGFVILTLIIANFTGLVGLGVYFPWAIPGMYIVSDTTEGMNLIPASYIILFLTSMLGFFGTITFWRIADQK